MLQTARETEQQGTQTLARTADKRIPAKIGELQGRIEALRAAIRERENLVNLEATIARVREKIDRLAGGNLTNEEATKFGGAFDTNAAKTLWQEAKDDLHALSGKRHKVAGAVRATADAEEQIADLQLAIAREQARAYMPLEGMDWAD